MILLVIGVAGAAVGYLIYRATRPDVRRPGEELPDITEKLSRNLPAEAPMPVFVDVTAAAGLAGFRSFFGDRTSQLPEDMGSGAAWGDFDNDGDDDLFLVAAGGDLTLPADEWAPSELFENLGDATFRRVEDFPELRISGMGAAWGDYNADGWQDLAITGYNSLLLWRNEQGRLVRDESFPDLEGYWSGVSWGDFDNDRDLDLYVCGYVQYQTDGGEQRQASQQYGTAVPYTLNPASFEPERNLLFQNEGDGTFTEVAELWGVSNPAGRSLGALWQDFDDDGRLDLYVANDISDNALFLNRGETFEDVSLAAWVADYRGAMGLAAGDWNRDGDEDLFVTHWIAQENALYDSRLVELERNRIEGQPIQLSFSDQAARLGLGQIALHAIGWGTGFVDLDADGWLDLLVINGSTLETDEVPKRLKPQSAMLLWNQQGEYFHDLAPLSELLATPHVGRGLALSDYDADGDLDILIVHLYEGVQLLRNDMQSGNWLQVRLRSRFGGTDAGEGLADGSSVTAKVGDVVLRRSLTGASYLSQSSRVLHFGLGEAGALEDVEVRWLAGETESFGSLEANSVWELTEGSGEPRRVLGSSGLTDREQVVEFWNKQRAGMDAVKKEGDLPKAIGLFRQALALNPEHEDSRYYLANCLAAQGDLEGAMAELDTMRRLSPGSHRAHKQWGVLRAVTAESDSELEAADQALERALEINQEATGSLLVLGEIALMQGDRARADERLAQATRTNPKAVGGFFLRGYMAWKDGESADAVRHLEAAQAARGEEWKPEGTVAEGDVASRMHREVTPLSLYWESWDGAPDPQTAFAGLDSYLASR
jgi:tetratricopeptide (TPR) repeat protein